MVGILVFFHCESNPGYAAASHEITFLKMAERLVGSYENIHFAYRTIKGGRSPTLPSELANIIEFDASSTSHEYLSQIENYIKRNDIKIAFGFDQPVRRLSHKYMRNGGIKHIISYWGAPMSSINNGLKLALKKIDVYLARHRPDHFIFQSEGMRLTAIKGRGIPARFTSIVKTGIDTERFSPPPSPNFYAHDMFNISRDKKIIFFSGHMERRKGVDVTIKTAIHLVKSMHRSDFHLLILGNKSGQEKAYFPLYKNTKANKHITFGGYRNDVAEILKSCSIGFIASTGWDSFPMSSIEMAATELPLVVSDLPGLREAISPETGFLYPPGDHVQAAEHISQLLEREDLRRKMGELGRRRAISEFSVTQQIAGLEAIVRNIAVNTLQDHGQSVVI